MRSAKMKQSEYIQAVSVVLDAFSEDVRKKIGDLGPRIPASTRNAEITIYVDDDGEGFLSVRVQLDGPDLYVLNKQIRDYAELFATRMVDTEMVPPLPLMEPDAYEFSVQHTLADCAADWLAGIWKKVDSDLFKIPVSIVAHDDYGTRTPIILRK